MRYLILSLLCTASPALGQETEIVVTGRALPEAVGEEVYATTIIDRERLTGSASGRLDEILKDIPGLQQFRRSDARSANPTSQGVTLRALGGNASSRALLLLDGVPQTDPFGGWISWPAYDPERLGSVRVVRGGGSGANGPGALAGTIELASATPSELRGAGGSVHYGSRSSIDARGGLGVDVGQSFLSLSADYGSGEGFIPIIEAQRGAADRSSSYEQASLAARAIAPVGTGVELHASGLIFRDERERGTLFSDIRTEGVDGSLRLVGRRWSALTYAQKRDFYNSFASVNDARTAANQVAEQFSVPSTGIGARFEIRPEVGPVELRFGGDGRETKGETRENFNFQNGTPTRGREAGGKTRTMGAFVEAGWDHRAITLTGGARIDRWWIRDGFLDERVLAGGEILTDTDFADRSGWEPTARAGLAWRLAGPVTFRSATYLGWRLPTLNELYRPFRVGADATAANAELSPERLEGVELGIDYRPNSIASARITLFVNRLEDSIANVTLDRGPGVFPGVGFVGAAGEYRRRDNLDAVVVKGIEIDGRTKIGNWSLSGGYSFVHAEVIASGAALPLDGLRPAQTPQHSLVATAGWEGRGGTRTSLTARYVGSQYEDDLNNQLIADALTFDAFASAVISNGISVQARAENITDARVVAGINNDGIIERATPRTFWIGLSFSN